MSDIFKLPDGISDYERGFIEGVLHKTKSSVDKAVNAMASKREWQGLTDEVIWREYQRLWQFHPAEEPKLAKDIAKFARAIEAKLKEKNA